MKSENRIVYLDVMRVLAIALVLMNHLPAYHLYEVEGGMNEAGALFLSVFTRVNVPLFAMVSGALLLGREESWQVLWEKRISRFLWVILIFSGLLYLMFGLLRGRVMSVDDFILGLIGGTLKDFDSYWYLYAYLGFLLMLPMLRYVARSMKPSDFWMLFGLHAVVYTVVPVCRFLLSLVGVEGLALSRDMQLSLSTVTLYFYPLMGYYLEHKVDVNQISRHEWGIIALVNMLAFAVSMGFTYWEGVESGFSQRYLNLGVYVNVISLYLVLKRLLSPAMMERHQGWANFFSLVGPLTFGVYLMDPDLKLLLYEDLKSLLQPTLHTFGFSLAWCGVSFLVCGSVTWLLKKVPWLRKLI